MVSKLNAYWLLVCGKSFSKSSVKIWPKGLFLTQFFLPFWKNDGDTDIHRQGGGNFSWIYEFLYFNTISK